MKFTCFFLVYGLGLFVLAPVIPVSAQVPGTEKIVFVSNRDGNSEIYIMNPDGSGQTNLTHHRGNDHSPVWSPTGRHILFASDRGRKTSDLYLMDADGARVRRVFGKKRIVGTRHGRPMANRSPTIGLIRVRLLSTQLQLTDGVKKG